MRDFFKNGLEPLSYLVYTIAVFFMLRKNKLGKKGVLFVYYLVASILITFACYTPSDSLNRIFYNLFFFVTAGFFAVYFKGLFITKLKKNVVIILLLIYGTVFLVMCLKPQHFLGINNYLYALTYLTIVLYSLFYFEQVLSNVSELNILDQFDFWLVSGYLIYFLSCFFIIFFYDNVDENVRALLWSVQNIILFFCSILTLSGSLWIRFRKIY